MHIHLQLDDVQVRGAERIDNPTHWPVFFAVDDTALRTLIGDVGSTWMLAPGAAPAGAKLEWRYAVPAGAALMSRARVGFGLLFSAGGADDASTTEAYQALVATVHALVLRHSALDSGLAALLPAFGGQDATDTKGPDLERLREGIDPAVLGKEIDAGLTERFAALRHVSDALRVLAPGAAVRDPVAVLPSPQPPPGRPGRPPTVPVPPSTRPVRPPVNVPLEAPRGVARLAPGTVLAVTLQAWRIDQIPPDRPLEFARALPTRKVPRISLRLSGRLRREA